MLKHIKVKGFEMRKISIILIILNLLILGATSLLYYGNIKTKSNANKVILIAMSNSILESNESIKISGLKINSIDNKKETYVIISSNNKNFEDNFKLYEYILIKLRDETKKGKIKSSDLININTKEKIKGSECIDLELSCGILIKR